LKPPKPPALIVLLPFFAGRLFDIHEVAVRTRETKGHISCPENVVAPTVILR
jgi:hypothetical protein